MTLYTTIPSSSPPQHHPCLHSFHLLEEDWRQLPLSSTYYTMDTGIHCLQASTTDLANIHTQPDVPI